MLDFTRAIEKIVPEDDGPGKVVRRKFTVAAINGDNTVNITDGAGVTTPNVPVLAGAQLIVGSKVQVLSERGAMLVLGKVGAAIAPPSVNPNAFLTFGTPTLTSGAITTLTPATVPVNDGPMYSGSGTAFTVPTGQGGLYTVGLVLRYASQASASGTRQARVNINGVENMAFQTAAVSPNLNSTNIIVNGAVRVMLNAGDVIEFAGYQNSGANLALVGNSIGYIQKSR